MYMYMYMQMAILEPYPMDYIIITLYCENFCGDFMAIKINWSIRALWLLELWNPQRVQVITATMALHKAMETLDQSGSTSTTTEATLATSSHNNSCH